MRVPLAGSAEPTPEEGTFKMKHLDKSERRCTRHAATEQTVQQLDNSYSPSTTKGRNVKPMALYLRAVRHVASLISALRRLFSASELYVSIGQQHSLRKPADSSEAHDTSSALQPADRTPTSACSGAGLATAVGISVVSALETESRFCSDVHTAESNSDSDDSWPSRQAGRDPYRTDSLPGRQAHTQQLALPCRYRDFQHGNHAEHRTHAAKRGGAERGRAADPKTAPALRDEQKVLGIFWMHRLPMYRLRMREICASTAAGAILGPDMAATEHTQPDSEPSAAPLVQLSENVVPGMHLQKGSPQPYSSEPRAASFEVDRVVSRRGHINSHSARNILRLQLQVLHYVAGMVMLVCIMISLLT